MGPRVMVTAGGTGGHVFPALAVAEELRNRGMEVFWLGTPHGLESRLVPEHGFRMERVSIQGLRGKGSLRWLAAPFRLSFALLQTMRVLLRTRPRLVLAMGGFVTGPGGLMARLLGIPLVIHEQNAIPGMTNQWLSRIATRVLEAFPGSFDKSRAAQITGNPVRTEITGLPDPQVRMAGRSDPLRLLVLGGSLGAQVLNEVVPAALSLIDPSRRPEVRHQAGHDKLEPARAAYLQAGVEADVNAFVEDMAEAYSWADLVICRAGALTIAELAVAGVGAILVPYPHAVDDHQTRNARYLSDSGAALLLPQPELSADGLVTRLRPLLQDRRKVLDMALAARRQGHPGATSAVADVCQQVVSQ